MQRDQIFKLKFFNSRHFWFHDQNFYPSQQVNQWISYRIQASAIYLWYVHTTTQLHQGLSQLICWMCLIYILGYGIWMQSRSFSFAAYRLHCPEFFAVGRTISFFTAYFSRCGGGFKIKFGGNVPRLIWLIMQLILLSIVDIIAHEYSMEYRGFLDL